MDKKKFDDLKTIQKKELEQYNKALRDQCETLVHERYGEEQVIQWSNLNKGLFYLPVLDDEGNILKLAVFRPITRHILSYAATKMTEGGLYAFLESAMRECFIEGDTEILDDDEFFIPAANTFNNVIERRKVQLVKR
jgi:hypothetical protein